MKTKYFSLIFYVSLALSLLGIIAECYHLVFDYQDSSALVYSIILRFKSIYLNIGFEYSFVNVYNIIFYILLFFGSMFFYYSEGKETRLLKFFYSVLLCSSIFWIIRTILQKIFFPLALDTLEGSISVYYFNVILSFILNCGYIFIGYWFLKLLSQNSILNKVVHENSNTINFTITKKIQRLFHLIMDTIILLFLFFIIADFFQLYSNINENNPFSEVERSIPSAIGFGIFITIIYYIFFETIFGATPGKFLTSSRVLNSKAELPNMKVIIIRTFCRQIPFDSFSFLAKRGWHDSISETYVVKENNENSYTMYIILLLIVSFLVIIYLPLSEILDYI
ncbi:RDD family protein [Frigoriflavimonas asaccharolytica]|uniref:Putative RDD family membrane protein YckC n=1 Tax=Frigoriflavimonas asaccharolytica TaxID=2735899 RepID=A0A8J8K8U6_9FLAO|nr:RDD family protein [Frigoriflavimonas asaccharolytica]NRS93243.1 putative RDD family membrane protein YckC [Frigoriflavimonas asaccharolytica]